MCVEGLEGLKLNISNRESRLWHYLRLGSGMHCPLYSSCLERLGDSWCPEDGIKLNQRLIDYDENSYENCVCAEGKASCSILKMVEMLANQFINKGEVHCPPVPVELVSLADEQHPIEIRSLPLKAYHGAVWGLGDKWIIQLKQSDTSSSKRFTTFHEVFHIISHRKTHGGKGLFAMGSPARGGVFSDVLADYFAACILMPRKWITERWMETHDFEKIARTFDVPISSLRARVRLIGLV